MIMQRSTIYRRHERRLAKTYALKDDPRPPMIRVMSGLPLLSLVFPPYQPGTANQDRAFSQQAAPSRAAPQRSSTETIFSRSASTEPTTAAQSVPSSPPLASSNSSRWIQVAFAAGTAGLVSEILFGRRTINRSHGAFNASSIGKPTSSTPFPHSPHSGSVSPQGMLSIVQPMNSWTEPLTMSRGNIALSSLALASGSTAILFGTKAFVDMKLNTASVETLSIFSVFSSIIAGATVGAVRAPFRIAQVPSSSMGRVQLKSAMNLLMREMGGAAVLFGTYDLLTGSLDLSSTDTQRDASIKEKVGPSMMVVSISGAISGSLYQSITSAKGGRFMPVILRAAPAHAVLFVCYEHLLRFVNDQYRVTS